MKAHSPPESALVLAALLYMASAALAAAPVHGQAVTGNLTIDEALAHALEREAVGAVIAGQSAAARAQAAAAGAFDNPGLAYEFERLGGPVEATVEHTIAVTKTFEVSGGRGLRRQAATLRADAVDAAGSRWRLDLEMDVRLAFYRVLHGERRVEAILHWISGLEESVAVIERRFAAGDTSEYDSLRLASELSRALTDLARETANRDRPRAALAALLGLPPTSLDRDGPMVVGDLLPGKPPPRSRAEPSETAPGPDLRVIDANIEAHRADAEAASRLWVPNLTVAAGYRAAESAGQQSHGIVLGLSAPMPLLHRGRHERAAAEAEASAIAAKREIVAERLATETVGAAIEAALLFDAAVASRRETERTSIKLLIAAAAAYREGEIGVIELVDAHLTHLQGQLRLLDIELAAREASVVLDRLVRGGNQ